MRHVIAICNTLSLIALALPGAMLTAQTVYKYRDSSGQWVFTDQATAEAKAGESLKLEHENKSMHLSVDRSDDEKVTRLVAVNDCLCVATFEVSVLQSGLAGIADGAKYHATLAPASRQTLAQAAHADGAQLRYRWRAALGAPDAIHNPTSPYRAPFGVGSTYVVSQAYPDRITHTTADSQYAIDIAMPDGTPIYAAREGIVINTRHDSFRGALAPVMLGQANFIQILHADGTIAIYAHLHWDSIRVRIGEHVARGQYLANSGNTGFTSGPHLHFAVMRNAGFEDVSLPVQFAGTAGVPISPASKMPLTAY